MAGGTTTTAVGPTTVTRGTTIPSSPPAVVHHTAQARASAPNVHMYSAAPVQAVSGAKAVFDSLDRNHDGVITRAEFNAAMGQAPASPVVASFTSPVAVATPVTYAAPPVVTQAPTPPLLTYSAPTMVQQPVTYAAPPVVVPAPQPQVVTYAAPPPVQVQETLLVEEPPPTLVYQAPPPPPPVVRQPIVYEAPPPQPIVYEAPPPPPPLEIMPTMERRVIEPIRVRESSRPAIRPIGGERVIEERPISREELFATGNLVEGNAERMPYRSERRLESRRLEMPYGSERRLASRRVDREARSVPIRRMGTDRIERSPRRLKPVQTYASRPLESVQTYAAPQLSSPVVETYAAPPLSSSFVSAVPMIPQTQVMQTAQVVQAAPMTYAAPPVTYSGPPTTNLVQMQQTAPAYYSGGGFVEDIKTYGAPPLTVPRTAVMSNFETVSVPRTPVSAFDMLDRNHDGVIDRAEFNSMMGRAY